MTEPELEPDSEAVGADFQPLKPASIHTESSGPGDATPLVVMEEERGQAEVEVGSDELTVPELVGEVKSLRSRNQILRTERTAIAGRKYALEQVVESLREKIEHVVELCEALDATGELGEAMKEILETLGDARRVAASKAVLEADLEEERAKHLEERRTFELQVSNMSEKIAGLQSSRDSLRDQVAQLQRERMSHGQDLAKLERQLAEMNEGEDKAAEQLETYIERISELEDQIEQLNTSRTEVDQALEDAVQHAEKLDAHVQELENGLDEGEAKLREAQEHSASLEGELAEAQARLQNAEGALEAAQADLEAQETRVATNTARLEAAEERAAEGHGQAQTLQARVTELEAEVGTQKATLDDQRKALIEVKPLIEDWSRLDKENQRLSRLVGEARDRGKVNIQELMARAALLKRLERLTSE